MNGKVDWNIFAYKFRNNPAQAFETLTYHMFCREFGIVDGLPALYNQKYIKTQPIKLADGRKVAFQSKYYENLSINMAQARNLTNIVIAAANTYSGLTDIYFYLNRPFVQSATSKKTKSSVQTTIEETAALYGITIMWIMPSMFEIILNRDDMKDLWDYYFKPVIAARRYPTCLTPIPFVDRVTFLGRQSAIEEARKMLEERRMVLISGIGGIGKTAVMRRICNDIMESADETNAHVAWIECRNSIKEDILTLQQALDISDVVEKEEIYQKIVNALRTMQEPVYLFLDNYLEQKRSDELLQLNYRHIHFMFTSRHNVEGVPTIYIDELSSDEAISMFYNYYSLDSNRRYESIVREIIGYVSHNPLLIELLAKAAALRDCTLEDFKEELMKKGFFDISQDKIRTTHSAVEMTIEEQVKKLYMISGLSEDQQRIMHLFTIFPAGVSIYGGVVTWAGYGEGTGEKREEFKELVRLGWLNRVPGGYIIHQIISDSVARQLNNQDLDFAQYGDFLSIVINTDYYIGKEVEHTIVTERLVIPESVAEYFEGRKIITEDAASLYNNIANVYSDQGIYEKALNYYEKALSIREKVLGTEHPDTASTYNNIANVYTNQSDYKKALEYYGKALSICEKVLGTEHLYTASTYNNIALVYSNQSDYERALEYYGKALSISERVLGSEHPDTAATYNNMANVYTSQGDYEQALEYYKKSLDIRETVLGSEHPDTASTYNNIANVYSNQGDYEKALEYYKKALDISEKVLGLSHPDTAMMYNNIALVYSDQGDYEKALTYYEKSLAICEAVLGRSHLDTASTYNNIANVYSDQGNYRKALGYYEKALTIYEKVLGREHPNIATAYNNMAGVYHAQGNYGKALKYYEKALDIYINVLGKKHPLTEKTYNNIKIALSARDEYSEDNRNDADVVFIDSNESLDSYLNRYSVTDINNLTDEQIGFKKDMNIDEEIEQGHFITAVKIFNVRHLNNITIKLNEEKRSHLILTGQNGAGKTSVLEAMRTYLSAINDGFLIAELKKNAEFDDDIAKRALMQYINGLELDYSAEQDLIDLYKDGQFITAYYPADRKANVIKARGVENIVLENTYPVMLDNMDSPANLIVKYMVHLKTQQSYARNEEDQETVKRIQSWFDRFEKALRTLFNEDSLRLEYDYKNYNFLIREDGRNPFGFDQLPDGYSAVLQIVADLMMRMEHNWLLGGSISTYDMEGIAIIDELETHLHIEMQRMVLPTLIELFPRVQFIVSTHSTYILNSIPNSVIYDLERKERYTDFSSYSSEEVAEAYFNAEEYSDSFRKQIIRYKELCEIERPTPNERAERAELRVKLKNISGALAPEIAEAMEDFEKVREHK